MKRCLFLVIDLFVVCFCLTCEIHAQTYYYKLTKIVKNGVSSSNTSGGQFITFNKSCCYESDKAGYSVENGRLDYKYVENGFKVYYGDSYLGSNSTCLVTQDLNTINMKAGDVVYVYKRATPPSGVTTCSLIRSASSPGGEIVNVPTQQIYSGGVYVPTPNNPTPTPTPTPTPSSTRRNCSNCHGSGTIVRENSTSTYGRDTQRYCNICGRSYWTSSGHSHVSCPICHGKGYLQ